MTFGRGFDHAPAPRSRSAPVPLFSIPLLWRRQQMALAAPLLEGQPVMKLAAHDGRRASKSARYSTVDEYIAALPEGLRETAVHTRTVVDANLEGGSSAIRWAHPTWSVGKEPIFYLKMATPKHVTFGFWRGASIEDRSGRLETAGVVMAHTKLRSIEDVDSKLFADWVRQARRLAAGG